MPANWLGRLLAIGLRRIVMKRLPEDGGVDVKRWGLRLRLHPRHNGYEKGLLFTPQFYEAGERAALAAWIAEARTAGQPFVFVDIGANVGLFSFFVASCAGANARILAIEPESENLRRLRFNIEANRGLADPGAAAMRSANPQARSNPRSNASRWRRLLAQNGVTRIDALRISVGGIRGSHPAAVLQGRAGQSVAAIHHPRGQPQNLARRSVRRIAGARLQNGRDAPGRMSCWN